MRTGHRVLWRSGRARFGRTPRDVPTGVEGPDRVGEQAAAGPKAVWSVWGGCFWAGRVLPVLIGGAGAVAIAGAGISLVPGNGRAGPGVAVFLLLLAGLTAWLLTRVLTTTWWVGMDADGGLRGRTPVAEWVVRRGELTAVQGDAYGLLLVFSSAEGRFRAWARMDDSQGLIAAVQRSNPRVEVDRYAARTAS